MKLPKILPQPNKPNQLPENIKWLSGEGAGSWFFFEELAEGIQIKRYSPKGDLECKNLFKKPTKFILDKDFRMDYPSHCAIVTIVQDGEKIRFSILEKST